LRMLEFLPFCHLHFLKWECLRCKEDMHLGPDVEVLVCTEGSGLLCIFDELSIGSFPLSLRLLKVDWL
jgi:hypothetical protein